MTTSTTKFGIELEAYGVDRSAVASAINAAGILCQVDSYGHTTRDYWKVVTDVSIQGAMSFEVVSPILCGDDGLAQVVKVCTALKSVGAKINESTGFHVHVDARTITLPVLKNVCRMWMKYESAFDAIVPAERRNNFYCKSITSKFASVTEAFTKIATAATAVALRSLVNPDTSGGGSGRYHKLNLHSLTRHGTIEFRQHSGTVDAAKVCNWVNLVVSFVDDAGKYATVRRDKVDGSLENLLKVTSDRATKKFYRERKAKFATTA